MSFFGLTHAPAQQTKSGSHDGHAPPAPVLAPALLAELEEAAGPPVAEEPDPVAPGEVDVAPCVAPAPPAPELPLTTSVVPPHAAHPIAVRTASTAPVPRLVAMTRPPP
jgi:hypothetical protein